MGERVRRLPRKQTLRRYRWQTSRCAARARRYEKVIHQWALSAACLDTETNVFFPETYDAQSMAEARAVCLGCDVITECIDYSVRARETKGIWGGLGWDRRRHLRSILAEEDAAAYVAAVRREEQRLRGEKPSESPETVCDRCGSRVRPGRRPIDRNRSGATCGKAATFNRGCRCDRCVEAKAAAQKLEPRRRRSPRGEHKSTPTGK